MNLVFIYAFAVDGCRHHAEIEKNGVSSTIELAGVDLRVPFVVLIRPTSPLSRSKQRGGH